MKEGLPFFLTSGRHTVKNGLPLQFFNQAGKVADVAADAADALQYRHPAGAGAGAAADAVLPDAG